MEPGETRFIGGKEITYCEFEIIRHAMRGLSRKQIAGVRGVSDDTIDHEMWLLYRKLEIHKINDLLAWAEANGFDHESNYSPKALVMPKVILPEPIKKKSRRAKTKSTKRKRTRSALRRTKKSRKTSKPVQHL